MPSDRYKLARACLRAVSKNPAATGDERKSVALRTPKRAACVEGLKGRKRQGTLAQRDPAHTSCGSMEEGRLESPRTRSAGGRLRQARRRVETWRHTNGGWPSGQPCGRYCSKSGRCRNVTANPRRFAAKTTGMSGLDSRASSRGSLPLGRRLLVHTLPVVERAEVEAICGRYRAATTFGSRILMLGYLLKSSMLNVRRCVKPWRNIAAARRAS